MFVWSIRPTFALLAVLLLLPSPAVMAQQSSLWISYMTPQPQIQAGTFNNVPTMQNPCRSHVTIKNSSGNCYISAVPTNICPDTVYGHGDCSTGPLYVRFTSANTFYPWRFSFGGQLNINGGSVLKDVIIEGGTGNAIQSVSNLHGSSTLTITGNPDITGSVDATSIAAGGINVRNVSGTLSLLNTGGNIAASGAVTGGIYVSTYTGTISAASIGSSGVIQLISGSAVISAPTISGVINVARDFTGRIEANGLTPETVPTNWSISPDCGWYVKDLTTGNVVQMPCAASGPFPADGQQDVVTWPLLAWKPASNAVRHKLYFGTTDGSPVYVDDLTEGWYEPGRLPTDTTYYWRVDEVADDDTVTTGPEWSFTTTASDPIIVRVDDNVASPQTPTGKVDSV